MCPREYNQPLLETERMFLKILDNEARNARPSTARRAAFAASHLEVRMFNVDHGEAKRMQLTTLIFKRKGLEL